MQYKTIILELLQQRPEMQEQLRKDRTLLPTLESYARGLKASHAAQMLLLSHARPGSSESQTAIEALEIALKELEDSLPPASSPDEDEPLSLDTAMAFLRKHTPPA